jgi:AcrR family transcriptional regulator
VTSNVSSYVNDANITSGVNGVNTGCQDGRVPAKERYHHGDLRAALVRAGVAAAREGGEQAVGLNRLAAGVGVSASAAYRHFPGGLPDLLVSVGDVARRELAERIALRTGEVEPADDPGQTASRRFRASGQAYVEYVLEEPGLFQVACRHDEGRAGDADPYALLARCVDDLVATGLLPEGRRADAPAAAWAAVHGLALLLVEGPLRRLPPARRDAVVQRTLDVVQRGL